ncbi:unnamed protein product [Owenia fusiformis]|uniref:Uncharacterized protein n=1 Tax=Owenia fusiformis TaxID=6347 RepID=A0A8J1XTX2_OWEFU|nr:unnamed protein product [Owenia fusiformis]
MSGRPTSRPSGSRGTPGTAWQKTTAKPTTGAKPKSASPKKAANKAGTSTALVPRSKQGAIATRKGMAPIPMKKQDGMLVPEGYTVRKIEPAKNYDVVSFARAMNPDFAPRVKKLFDPEREAAIAAQKSGVYIGWRCPEFTWDCQRVSSMSKCFCGHLLGEHNSYNGHSVRVPCRQPGCSCKAFAWIPSRPEEIGEFWFARRRDFDPEAWRAKCRCKHTHEDHDPNGMRRCKMRGCGCSVFDSPFLCAACDQHWEVHETFFETESMRRDKGLPYGEEYLPFHEMPELRNIVLTGEETDDSVYRALTEGEGAIPHTNVRAIADNNTPFSFGGGGRGGGRSGGFRPTYD